LIPKNICIFTKIKPLSMQHIPTLFITQSPLGGRGVFVGEDLPAGSFIELCPVIIISEADKKKIHETYLHDYYFLWGTDEKRAAIALGYGSLYNHSYAPNAQFIANIEEESILIESIQPIQAGSEITINYNGDVNDKSPLWF